MPSPSRRYIPQHPLPTDTSAPSTSNLRKRKTPPDLQVASDRISGRSYRPLSVRQEIAHQDQVSAYLSIIPPSRRALLPAYLTVCVLISTSPTADAAENQCQFLVDNTVESCFPVAGTSIPQHEVACLVCASPIELVTLLSGASANERPYLSQGTAGYLR